MLKYKFTFDDGSIVEEEYATREEASWHILANEKHLVYYEFIEGEEGEEDDTENSRNS